ncbi:MEIKN protein, partial [Serilophus lunatus]|nr:MEIKN protein [Serilophus lunatus]
MTLPTGVSTFLIQCLDEESTADFNNTSDSLKSYSSPETFRSDASERSGPCVDPGKYRNSTLLDSSRAVTIDKILQLSNLSAILEPAPEDFQDQYIRRKKPSNCNYSSSELNISATLAGKKLCKITAAGERTPDLESGMRCSSPLGARSKLDSQTAKPKRLKGKKKETNFGLSEEGSSSFRQLDAPGSTSAANPPDLAEAVPPKAADAVVVPLCDRKEICSIVRMSPGQRSSSLKQAPVKRRKFCPPRGVPEDSITSTKNWIY